MGPTPKGLEDADAEERPKGPGFGGSPDPRKKKAGIRPEIYTNFKRPYFCQNATKSSETKTKVVALEETKRMVPHTTSNSLWFDRKMPRKPRRSPETGRRSRWGRLGCSLGVLELRRDGVGEREESSRGDGGVIARWLWWWVCVCGFHDEDGRVRSRERERDRNETERELREKERERERRLPRGG
uniref:Uncharacterized protein n=1 Tax=Malus domestica TaxID=3750 RepID=G0XZB6_MALDO|nr:hypothetical protein [Malus domestica]